MFGLVAEPERVEGLGEVRLARRDAGQHADVTGVLETLLQNLRQHRVSGNIIFKKYFEAKTINLPVGNVFLSPYQASHHSV